MYRAPPDAENRNAAGASRGVGKNGLAGRSDSQLLKPNSDADQVVFTAVPRGLAWQVKALSPNGDVSRHGRFNGRLEALGACVLLARQCGGEVRP
jgi:hypothetical protein